MIAITAMKTNGITTPIAAFAPVDSPPPSLFAGRADPVGVGVGVPVSVVLDEDDIVGP
jgi:hypothetical protein